ncbi:hypothetical protein OXYTRIMIC_093 [Oxytricha trifallax]|uniref:Uncharacterized protein n=1 Tax=Oxytricha trifallax TaxID=1172189 RepID=A0A073HYG7_9SPIT|nr:hypothetical protein OXYTRIMIC_093 [Oxytricha trifallax]
MSKFEINQDPYYACSKCKQQTTTYHIYTDLVSSPRVHKSMDDIMNALQNSLYFYCFTCYRTKILNLNIVQLDINSSQNKVRELQQLNMNLMLKFDEQEIQLSKYSKYSVIPSFIDDELSKQIKFFETKLQEAVKIFSQADFKNKFMKYQESFKQKITGTLKTLGEKLQTFAKSEVDKSMQNVEQLNESYSKIVNSSWFLIVSNVMNLGKINDSIQEDIKLQNLQEKELFLVDLEQYLIQFESQPQSIDETTETADSETHIQE